MAKQTFTDENGKTYVKQSPASQRSRTAELVLAIIGGIFGIIAGLLSMTVGSINSAVGNGSGGLGTLGVGCIAAAVAAIILSAFINKNHVLVGWLLIIAGALNIVFVSFVGILSGLLIIIAGILALRK